MRTTERRRRIARSVPPAMHDTPNMNGPAVPLPVRGRFPFVVVGVVGAVVVVSGDVVVVGPPCWCTVVVVPGRVVVVNAVVTGGPSEVVVSGTVVVVSDVVVVVSGAVVVVFGAVVVVS
jgi:hypothetical protein